MKSVRPSVRPPAAFEELHYNTLKMDSVIPPFWKNPLPDFLGLSGQYSDRPPKHILKVSACFSKCPGQTLICLY